MKLPEGTDFLSHSESTIMSSLSSSNIQKIMSLFSSISIKDKALFYENVANLLEWGVTLLSALHGLRDRLGPGKLQEWVDHLVFFVEWWDPVNVAMRKLPNFFEEQEVAIVESGEQTGMIQKSFLAIANDLRAQDELRSKVMGALTYPFIILLFLGLALSVVMVYVVPQLMPIIGNLSSELPWTTRTLIGSSEFLKGNFIYIILTLIAVFFIFQWYTRTDHGKYWWDKQKFSFPLIGNVYKNYLIVRVMSTFYLLNSSWISIVKTLRLTGSSAGNAVIYRLFSVISDDVAHGTKISTSMQDRDSEHTFFTADILQMIESAERTSTLAGVTQKIATQYKREVDTALATMVKFIEPIALLLAWVFVLWFAIAIFSAIMQIVSIAGN